MSKGLVLVTGANGYIAGRTIEAFLKAGYSVRGTVRSMSKAKGLLEALSEYADNLEIVQVPDIAMHAAFDTAMRGVDAVAHLASPVPIGPAGTNDAAEIRRVAVEGTQRALESANLESRVKTFVYLSSVMAVAAHADAANNPVFTEEHWASSVDASGGHHKLERMDGPMAEIMRASAAYAAGKTAAEKAVLEFKKEHEPEFGVVTVVPAAVAGPPLVLPQSPKDVPFSLSTIMGAFVGRPLDTLGLGGYDTYVDVRDVARLVVFAVEQPLKAHGERILAANEFCSAREVAHLLRREFPDRASVIPEVHSAHGTGHQNGVDVRITFDGSKAVRLTGQEYIPFRQTVVDTVDLLKPLLVGDGVAEQ